MHIESNDLKGKGTKKCILFIGANLYVKFQLCQINLVLMGDNLTSFIC